MWMFLEERKQLEIKKQGGEAVFFRVDIGNEEECKQLAENVVTKYGQIDILVNNAAMHPCVKFSNIEYLL